MPSERRYKAGSVVYFEHENGTDIYVLKSGRMDLSYDEPQTGEKITKTLNEGEFIGLKSAIIGHTRDEMVQAITDCIVIVFNIAEFESFVSKNVELMKRLLKVLSNQIRNLGIKVNNYLGNNVLYPPNIGLFKIGEYYLNNKQYKPSIQVYERYIANYGDTNLVDEAKFRIEITKEAQKTGFLKKFRPVDEIIDTKSLDTSLGVADTKASLEGTHSKLGLKEFMNSFYKAESFFNANDYASAEKEFKELDKVDTKMVNVDLRNKARLMYIETLYKLHKLNECSQMISQFIPVIKDPTVVKKTLLIMCDIYVELKNIPSATAMLQKVVMMNPIDDISKRARERLTKLQVSGK